MTWLKTAPPLMDSAWIHGWTTIDGPDFSGDPAGSNQIASTVQLANAVGLDHAAWVHQVHGGQVLYTQTPGLCGEADAMWTDQPGLGVVGRSADCPLLLVGGLRHDGRRIWGFAHASWRSTIARITSGLMKEMVGGGLDAAASMCVICPSAGPCCYEVGDEVRQAALAELGNTAQAFFPTHNGQLFFDLWSANKAQLMAAGVPQANIHITETCTICGDGSYPSYRRQGDQAGRIAAIIGASTRD